MVIGGVNVAVDGHRARVDDADETFVVADVSDGRFRVQARDGEWTMSAVRAGATIWVWCDGYLIDLEIGEASSTRRTGSRDQDALTPPMPATVVRVQVQPGQQVSAGDTLIVLEAMKMELPIRAPRAATVRAVTCIEGQLVQPGDRLLDLE